MRSLLLIASITVRLIFLILLGHTLLLYHDRGNGLGHAYEMTIELPDSERMCFFEMIDRDIKCTLEFQVITGGNYDVDVEVISTDGKSLYKDTKKQFDSFTFTTDRRGEYQFCFSNEFSTFTHKLVYFDFTVGDNEPIKSALGNQITALTQLEMSAQRIHENLKTVVDYQTHHRLREAQGVVFAEDLSDRVQFWSFGQSIIILAVGLGQILCLRSLFTERRLPQNYPLTM